MWGGESGLSQGIESMMSTLSGAVLIQIGSSSSDHSFLLPMRQSLLVSHHGQWNVRWWPSWVWCPTLSEATGASY